MTCIAAYARLPSAPAQRWSFMWAATSTPSNEVAWQRLVSKSAAIAIAPGPFVIDIRDLDFMGSCAYAVLAQESVRCRRRGVNMRLVSNQPIVARTIAACGLRRLIPLYATVETALAPPPSAH